MTVIAILQASDVVDQDQIAPTRRSTPGPDGGHVPTGLAGYVWDGAAYCPECATDVMVENPDGDGETSVAEYPAYTDDGDPATDPNGFGVGVVSCSDEWDYLGASCHVCHRLLDTNILVYDGGGAHPTPVVEVRDPDGVGRFAEAFVLEVDQSDVRIMLAEEFSPYGDVGDTSWIPRSDVVEEYHEQLD